MLLIDEMSQGLAPVIVKRMIPFVETAARSGIAVLLVEQFAALVLSIGVHAYVLSVGRIVLEGPRKDLLARPDDVRHARSRWQLGERHLGWRHDADGKERRLSVNAPTPSSSSAPAAPAGSRVVQLGHVLQPGQTRNGTAPYSHALTSGFGELIGSVPGQSPDIRGVSDMISPGYHTGTHMDSLAHVSYNGALFDRTKTSGPGAEDYFHGVVMNGLAENFRPIVARGVLLDFARYLGVDRVSGDYVITPTDMAACAASQDVTFGSGDVVLFRMGYDVVYRDPANSCGCRHRRGGAIGTVVAMASR